MDSKRPWIMKRTLPWLLVSLACAPWLAPAVVAAEAKPAATPSPPSVQALLDKYAESQRIFRSFVITFEETWKSQGVQTGERHDQAGHQLTELCYDGQRGKFVRTRWGYVQGNLPNLPRDKAQPQFKMWDGQRWYQYDRSFLPGVLPFLMLDENMDSEKARREVQGFLGQNYIPYWHHYFRPDQQMTGEPLDQALRRAERVKLRPNLEAVGGSFCYVLEAKVDQTQYTLWLDPQHGYHLAKAVGVSTNGGVKKALSERTARGNVRFQNIAGVWIPVEMDTSSEVTGPGLSSKSQAHYKCTSFLRDPDHEARRSFQSGFVANGTLVSLIGPPGTEALVRHVWMDGRLEPLARPLTIYQAHNQVFQWQNGQLVPAKQYWKWQDGPSSQWVGGQFVLRNGQLVTNSLLGARRID